MGRIQNDRVGSQRVARIAAEVFDEARRRRFIPPSCVLDEEEVERYAHQDLRVLHEAELHHESVQAGAALRALPKSEISARRWWAGRYAAVLLEFDRRRRAP